MNQGHFLMKGLRQVRAEFSLSALAYNLLRVMNIVGVRGLVEALGRLLRALRRATRRRQGFAGWFCCLVVASTARRKKNLRLAGLPA